MPSAERAHETIRQGVAAGDQVAGPPEVGPTRGPAVSRQSVLQRLRVHHLDWPGTDPPILLLHPNRANAHVWASMVARSTSPNRFIAVDQRGHGASEWPATGYGVDDVVADAAEFIETVCGGPAVVVGAAAGATTALLVAAEHPELVSAVVAMNPGIAVTPAVVAGVREHVSRGRGYATLEEATAALPFAAAWPEAVTAHYAAHAFEQVEDDRWVPRFSASGAAELAAALQADLWPRLAVTCPALLVRGERSPIFDHGALARLAGLVPHAVVVEIAGAGHYPMQDAPGVVAAELDAFITRPG